LRFRPLEQTPERVKVLTLEFPMHISALKGTADFCVGRFIGRPNLRLLRPERDSLPGGL
jgi:hypothetical protein